MMKISLLHPLFTWFVIGLIGILLAWVEGADKRIVCFYNSRDSGYMHPYDYRPSEIPTELCTDLVFASAEIDEETWEVVAPPLTHGTDIMRQFTALGAGPNFLLSVGGGSLWSAMAADASKRLSFIVSALHLLRDYGFNGLNLYWSTPHARDRENYVKLVEELVEAFKPSRLLLTSAVSLGMIVQDHVNETVSGYNIQRLSELFDWINVVDHTLRAPWKNDYVDVPSPLYRRSFDGNEGVLPFLNLICRLLSTGKWHRRFDHDGKCPYAFRGDQWVGYEDEQSIRIKMEYVKNRGYGGANVWAVNMDDFNGFCGSKNPLLHAVHEALGKKRQQHLDPSGSEEEMLRKRYQAMGISTCNAPTTSP